FRHDVLHRTVCGGDAAVIGRVDRETVLLAFEGSLYFRSHAPGAVAREALEIKAVIAVCIRSSEQVPVVAEREVQEKFGPGNRVARGVREPALHHERFHTARASRGRWRGRPVISARSTAGAAAGD